MPGDAPIVVNSAGCGAALKDYGRLLGTAEAAAFSAGWSTCTSSSRRRSIDCPRRPPPRPCHRAGPVPPPPRAAGASRRATVLGRVADVVELDDDGLCCGAGGAYSALQPELAGRSVTARSPRSARTRRGRDVVASGNPGCAMHLAAAGRDVRHPIELVAEAIGEVACDGRGAEPSTTSPTGSRRSSPTSTSGRSTAARGAQDEGATSPRQSADTRAPPPRRAVDNPRAGCARLASAVASNGLRGRSSPAGRRRRAWRTRTQPGRDRGCPVPAPPRERLDAPDQAARRGARSAR